MLMAGFNSLIAVYEYHFQLTAVCPAPPSRSRQSDQILLLTCSAQIADSGLPCSHLQGCAPGCTRVCISGSSCSIKDVRSRWSALHAPLTPVCHAGVCSWLRFWCTKAGRLNFTCSPSKEAALELNSTPAQHRPERSRPAAQAYARLRSDAPELADLSSAAASDETFTARGAKRQRIFEDHLPEAEISAGIKRGTLHQVAALSL